MRLTGDRDILIVAVISVLTGTASGILIPVWPIYIVKLGATMTELGLVLSTSNVAAAMLQIPSGWLSDRLGRRKLHALGVLLGIFPPIMYAYAESWLGLVPWALLAGLSTGLSSSIRWTVVADASPEKMASSYSLTIAGMLTGWTLGPFLGGFLSDLYGINAAFLATFLMYTTAFVLALVMRETTRRYVERSPVHLKSRKTLLRVLTIFSAVNILQGIGFGMFSPVTPVFIKSRFDVGLTQLGIIYALGTGLPATLIQLPGGKIAERYSKKKLIMLTIIFSSPFNATIALSRNMIELFLSLFLNSAILNIAWPAYQALMMESTPRERRGLVNGVSMTTMWVGMTVGSALSGPIWENLGANFPFYAITVFFLASAIPITLFQEE